ncbi:glycosyltransferase [Granulicella sp. WH15]|uniref:glycosyltransferase family 2 protein n=1 Tax=Granulicella sp. WH15 TaxID=2602070 RepID=UPI0013A5713E|nr:glycosyltransferase [Granulicella sp. WH15]
MAMSPPDPISRRLSLAVGIATRGRPRVLAETIADLEQQSRQPDRIVISYAEPGDIGDAPERFPQVDFVQGPLGLTNQRNAILAALHQEDVVLFLDDDFYLEREYIHKMANLFLSRPEVVVATGRVLADGINGPGLSLEEAKAVISAHAPEEAGNSETTPVFNAYGCNMCLRMQPIREHQLRFDVQLPLYGWYEDVDFSRQLAAYGAVVLLPTACGVHLGSKSGRQSGLRLGYSQVANPVYLARKRSVPWSYAIASMMSRSLKNVVRSFAPEPYVDRRGRLRGNLMAWKDLLTGTIAPTRILNL